MNHAVERSIQLFKITQHPLRCLSETDPCNLKKSVLDQGDNEVAQIASDEEAQAWEKP